MKIYHQCLILLLVLVLALGTTTACSTDKTSNNNNNNNKTDTGLIDTDNTVEDIDNTDPDVDDQKDIDNTDQDVDDQKDIDNTDQDVDDQKDIDNTDQDTEEQDQDTEEPPDEDKTRLQDLTEQQVLDLCATENDNVHDFFDPANDTGQAYCLLYAAYAAYNAETEPADKIALCEATVADCEANDTSVNLCINNNGCRATVADFERCSNANLASFAMQTTPLLGKTCADFTTEDSFQILDQAIDAYDYPQECITLNEKCPNLYIFQQD